MKSETNVACIILNYNDWELTKQLANNISNYESINEVIVVDNCSSDNSYNELCKIKSDKIIVIKSESNLGYGFGNNIGADFAIENYNSDYLLISNPDVIFTDDFVRKLLLVYEQDPNCAVVSGVQLDANGEYRWSAWPISSKKEWLLRLIPYIEHNYVQSVHEAYHQKKNSGDLLWKVDCVSGALFMIDAKKFMKVGGYDPNIFLYLEENILGLKLKQAGYNSYIVLNCEYNHLVSYSIKKNADIYRQRSWLLDSSLKMLKDYYHASKNELLLYKTGFKVYTRLMLLKNKIRKK